MVVVLRGGRGEFEDKGLVGFNVNGLTARLAIERKDPFMRPGLQ
jgi:hypothetical protein